MSTNIETGLHTRHFLSERKLVATCCAVTLIAVPIGMLRYFDGHESLAIIRLEDGDLKVELAEPTNRSRIWRSSEITVQAVAHANPTKVRQIAGDVFVCRGVDRQTIGASLSVALRNEAGFSRLGSGALIYPDDIIPAPVTGSLQVELELVGNGRQVKAPFLVGSGHSGFCGDAADIFPAWGSVISVVSCTKHDRALAIRVASYLDLLCTAFESAYRRIGDVESRLPRQVIVSSWTDIDPASPHLDRPFGNVVVGPRVESSSSVRLQVAGIVAAAALSVRHDVLADPASLAFVGAFADLIQETLLGGRGQLSGDISGESAARRLIRTSDLQSYLRCDPLREAIQQGHVVQLFSPHLRRLIELSLDADCATNGRGAGPNRCISLLSRLADVSESGDLRTSFDGPGAILSIRKWIHEHSVRIEVSAATEDLSEPKVLLEVAGELSGFLESCGCRSSKGGGFIDLYRRWGPHARRNGLRLLLGECLSLPSNIGYSKRANELIVSGTRDLGVDAFVPGTRELGALASGCLDSDEFAGLPMVACNVASKPYAEQSFARYVDARHGDVDVRIIGVVRPSPRRGSNAIREMIAEAFEISDPEPLIREIIHATPLPTAIVVAGSITPTVIRNIHLNTERRILVVSNDGLYPCEIDGEPFYEQRDGNLGALTIEFSSHGPFEAKQIEWRLSSGSATSTLMRLADSDANADAILAIRERIRAVVESDTDPVELDFTEPLLGIGATYVGSDECTSCHLAEFEQWRSTPHAAALRTLERLQRQGVRNCVACHVVGYDKPSGFNWESRSASLAGVGCEVCHGPGSAHIKNPSFAASIRRTPEDSLCASCHTLKHSAFLEGDSERYRRSVFHH